MGRFDPTDAEWAVTEPVLPTDTRGVERVDDRRVLDGLVRRLRTGGSLGRHPSAVGPSRHVRRPFPALAQGRGWDRLLDAVSKAYDGDLQMIDATSVRVHRHAATAKESDRSRCTGRCRGGLTTKIHALVDAEGRPIALELTEGQAHDGRSLDDMLAAPGPGRILFCDRSYDSDERRDHLAEQRA